MEASMVVSKWISFPHVTGRLSLQTILCERSREEGYDDILLANFARIPDYYLYNKNPSNPTLTDGQSAHMQPLQSSSSRAGQFANRQPVLKRVFKKLQIFQMPLKLVSVSLKPKIVGKPNTM